MQPKTQNAITGGITGALLGSIPGYLIDKGGGAAWGALLGGLGLAIVGYTATSSPPSSGLGRPRGVGLPQLSPRTGVGKKTRVDVHPPVTLAPETPAGTIMPCVRPNPNGPGWIPC